MGLTRNTTGLRAAIALTVATGLTLFSMAPAQAGQNDPITMPDAALLACINDELGQGATDPVTEAQAGGITELDCSEDGVSDLTGMEHLTSLVSLNLKDNSITDAGPLGSLTSLELLNLNDNSISDVSPLAGLTDLETLYLDDNNLTDATPLGSLASLSRLHLDRNSITDVAPLGNLTSLQFLSLSHNGASDVSPLENLTSLWQLSLNGNGITDVGPLANLGSVGLLNLSRNDISDVNPLAGLNATTLRLGDNNITDLSSLSGLSNVQDLSLQDNMITDVSPLASLSTLRNLSLMRNSITDLSPLEHSLATIWAANQSVDLGEIVIDTEQPNPVIGEDGQAVALDDLYDVGTNTFTPTTTGPGELHWPVGIGFTFGGTLSFTVTEADEPPADIVTVTKSVDASFVRVHDWTLAKAGEVGEVTVDGDSASAEVDYTVTATPGDYRDDHYMLTGEIEVTNEIVEPHSFTITDTVNVGVDATCDVTLDGEPAENIRIGASETVIFDYSCDLPETPEDGTNTATVSWFGGEQEVSVTEDVVFEQGEASFDTVTVVDDQTTPADGWETLGEADWNADGTPTEFTYSLTHDGLATGECASVTNVAMINQTEQTAEETVEICPEAGTPPAPELPKTGANVKGGAAAALLLLVTGGAALMLRRRQQN